MDHALNTEIVELEGVITESLSVSFERSPKKIMQSLNNKVDNGVLTKSSKIRDFIRGEIEYFPKRQQGCLVALTYWYLARKERDAGNLSEAWKLLCKSTYFVGLTDGREEPKQTAAAQGRSEKSQWRKLQIAKLISQKRPVDGWIRERDAANLILDDAVELNEKLKMNLTRGRLATLITEWIKEDGSAAQAAFHGTYVIESG